MPRFFNLKTSELKKEVKNRKCHINVCSQFCHLSISEKSKAKFQYVCELELAKEGKVLKNFELRKNLEVEL